MRFEDDNIGVFSAIFYKAPIHFPLARCQYKHSRAHHCCTNQWETAFKLNILRILRVCGFPGSHIPVHVNLMTRITKLLDLRHHLLSVSLLLKIVAPSNMINKIIKQKIHVNSNICSLTFLVEATNKDSDDNTETHHNSNSDIDEDKGGLSFVFSLCLDLGGGHGGLIRVSPEEIAAAFILAVARDIQRQTAWRPSTEVVQTAPVDNLRLRPSARPDGPLLARPRAA